MFTEVKVNKAIHELEKFYAEKVKSLWIATWVLVDVEPTGPVASNAYYDDNGILTLPIWSGASDKTIYSDRYYNYLFRFWHDFLHLVNGDGCGLDFSYESELTLAKKHCGEVEAAGLSDLARRILWIDTAGQQEYFLAQGEFPVNQRAFLDSCLHRGIPLACAFKH